MSGNYELYKGGAAGFLGVGADALLIRLAIQPGI
jgi:hypothetical protein